jgi:hypothetical protein
MSVDSSSWTEKATHLETSFSNSSVRFPHVFYIRRTMVIPELKILNSSYDLFLIFKSSEKVISYFKKTLFHKFSFSEMLEFFNDHIADLEEYACIVRK